MAENFLITTFGSWPSSVGARCPGRAMHFAGASGQNEWGFGLDIHNAAMCGRFFRWPGEGFTVPVPTSPVLEERVP
jgi:hypothetical protein